MFNLIPISLLITAIGGIVYIISNHLSEFSDDEENSDGFQFNFKARFMEWANQLPLDSIKSQSLSLTQKLLHRFRLTLLKTDNHLTKLINKIPQQNKMASGNGTPDFWEDLAKNKDEKRVVIPIAEPEVKINLAVKSEAAKKFFDIQPAKKTLKTKKSSK